jgi:hypothetical protein
MPVRISTCIAAAVFLALSSMAPSWSRAASFGTVTGVITWQYNDFVGTKGDVGAHVILLPVPLKHTLPPSDAKTLGLGIVEPGSTAERDGVLIQQADGYGNVEFDDVRPGDYDVIIISEKTLTNNSQISDDDFSLFQQYFVSYFATQQFLDGLIKIHKWTYLAVHVRANGKAHFSHDFGNTDF